MSDAPRTRLTVVQELHGLTGQMAQKGEDSDFLLAAVDKRQALMDEYDSLQAQEAAPPSGEELAEIKRLAQEMLGLDKAITDALEGHKLQAKTAIASANTRRRVLEYLDTGAPRSGSHMDFKE